MANLGFIGAGNMGYAMLKGAANVFPKEDLTYTDVNKTRLEEIKKETDFLCGWKYFVGKIRKIHSISY